MWLRPALFLSVLAAVLVDGCIDAPRRGPFRGPPPVGKPGYDPAKLKVCVGELDRLVARYALLPDRTFGGGCSALGSVQLRDIGLPTTNLGAMTCPLARAFTLWVQNDLQIPAMADLGSEVVRIESFGTYACRNVNGAAEGRLSEHAYANAVDISAFVLKDGRRVSVLTGWADEREGRFLRQVRSSACRRFGIVLSPDYNAAHADHLHFDMGRGPLCH